MTPPRDRRASAPRNLAIAGRELAIAWADGHESYLPFDELRASCPCAACRAEASRATSAGPLRLMQAPPVGAITIVALRPVGAYAVQIVWSDGHDSGIYPFERLRDSCRCDVCTAGKET